MGALVLFITLLGYPDFYRCSIKALVSELRIVKTVLVMSQIDISNIKCGLQKTYSLVLL